MVSVTPRIVNATRDNPHYRALAGTLELFLGAYFIDFGFVAILFFARKENPDGMLLSAAGALCGALLVLRARRLLAWHRWIFWFVTVVIILVPIGWFVPALIPFR